MEILIEIRTPKGYAESTGKKIKPFILGIKDHHETRVSPEDDCIYWRIEDTMEKCFAIQKKVAMFDQIIKTMFEHKLMKKVAETQVNKEDLEQLYEMLKNQTTVTVIKKSAQDALMQEQKQRSFWEKVKDTFRKA